MNIQRNILSLLISISLAACGVSNSPAPTLSSQGIDTPCTSDLLPDTGFDAKGTLKLPLLSNVQGIQRVGKKLFAVGPLSSDSQCIAVVGLDASTGKPLEDFGNKGLATLRVADAVGARAVPKSLVIDPQGMYIFVAGSVDSPTDAQKGFLVSFDLQGKFRPLFSGSGDGILLLYGSFGTYESAYLTTYATSINALTFLSDNNTSLSSNSLALVGRVRRETLFGKPNDDIFMAVLTLSPSRASSSLLDLTFELTPGRITFREFTLTDPTFKPSLELSQLDRRGPIQHNIITDGFTGTNNQSNDTAMAATATHGTFAVQDLIIAGVSELNGKHMASTGFFDMNTSENILNFSGEREFCQSTKGLPERVKVRHCETRIYGRWNPLFAPDSLKVLPSWTVSNAQVYMDSPWAKSTGVLQSNNRILTSGSHKITDGYSWHKAFYLMAYTAPSKSSSQLDASFGEKKGISSTTFSVDGTVVDAFGQALLEQGDKDKFLGYIIVGYISDGFNSEMALARYTTDGMTDKTFGSAGNLTTSLGQTKAYSGVVGQSGEIFAAGELKEVTGMTVGIVQRFDKDGLMSP